MKQTLLSRRGINCAFSVLLLFAISAPSDAQAQTRRKHVSEPKQVEHPAPAPSLDKKDSMVTAPGPFAAHPYWLGLSQCGGIYFKLNTLYADIAAHARAVKPDPRLTNEYTQKLNDAIKTATAYFSGAEHLLMSDRGLERVDAVLIYDEQSRAAGSRVRTIDAALNAAKGCPALYQACREAYPKACADTLSPIS